MTETDLLQNEARDFLEEKLNLYLSEKRGYRHFYADMLLELGRLFQPEHKLIFLEELLICSGAKCW